MTRPCHGSVAASHTPLPTHCHTKTSAPPHRRNDARNHRDTPAAKDIHARNGTVVTLLPHSLRTMLTTPSQPFRRRLAQRTKTMAWRRHLARTPLPPIRTSSRLPEKKAQRAHRRVWKPVQINLNFVAADRKVRTFYITLQ